MNKVLYSGLLFSILLFSPARALDEVNISNAHIRTSAAEGLATLEAQDVSISSFPLKMSHPAPVIHFKLSKESIEAQMDELFLDYSTNSEGLLSSLSGVDTNNFDLYYKNAQELRLSLDYLTLNFNGQRTHIPQLDLSCQRDHLKSLPFNLDLCLQVGKIEMPVLNLDQLTMNKISSKFLSFADPIKSFNKAMDKIENINIQILRGSLYMTFKAKFLFRWKVKVKGHTHWNQEKEQLRIDIHSAKVGFLSIKRTLLKEIREANISSLKVHGDSLILQL